MTASMSTATPSRCTGMMALVRGERQRARSSGSSCMVSSISAKMGRARLATMAPTEAMKVTAGTMTSSPGPTPRPASPRRSAAVPLVDGGRVSAADVGLECLLERSNLGAQIGAVVAEERLAVEHFHHRRLLLLADDGRALVAVHLTLGNVAGRRRWPVSRLSNVCHGGPLSMSVVLDLMNCARLFEKALLRQASGSPDLRNRSCRKSARHRRTSPYGNRPLP